MRVGRSGLHPRASPHAALPRRSPAPCPARPAGPLARSRGRLWPSSWPRSARPLRRSPAVPAVFQARELVSPDLRPRPYSLTDRTLCHPSSSARDQRAPPDAASLGYLLCDSAWHATASPGPEAQGTFRPVSPLRPLLSQRGPCPARPDGVLSLGCRWGSALLAPRPAPGSPTQPHLGRVRPAGQVGTRVS